MATVKLVLDTRRIKSSGKYPLVIRVTHRSKTTRIYTQLDLELKFWSTKTGYINKKYSNYREVKKVLDAKLKEVNNVILDLESSPFHYTVQEIRELLYRSTRDYTFNTYAEEQIAIMKKQNRFGNASAYGYAVASVSKFGGNQISFEEMNFKFISAYEQWLLVNKVSINGIGFYMRSIRAIYNKAIKEDVVAQSLYPFNKYKIKSESTRSRAISLKDIKRIYNLDLAVGTPMWHARNYFILTFCLIGVNFTDLAQLTPTNIKNGRVQYRRAKTKKLYDVKITSLANEILRLYSDEKTHYLIPVLGNREVALEELKISIKSKLSLVNAQLKKIGVLLELDVALTTYVARYSWANIAKDQGCSNEVIADALGHGYGNMITAIYLDAFDKAVVDHCNEAICNALMGE